MYRSLMHHISTYKLGKKLFPPEKENSAFKRLFLLSNHDLIIVVLFLCFLVKKNVVEWVE